MAVGDRGKDVRAPRLGAEAQVPSVCGSEGLFIFIFREWWETAGGGPGAPHVSRKDSVTGGGAGAGGWAVCGGSSPAKESQGQRGGWLRRWWVWVVGATGWTGGGRGGADRKKGSKR